MPGVAPFPQLNLSTISTIAGSCYIENLAGVPLENSLFHVMSESTISQPADIWYVVSGTYFIVYVLFLYPINHLPTLFGVISQTLLSPRVPNLKLYNFQLPLLNSLV